MGYLMRYISADERPVSLALIEDALNNIDPAYAIINTELEDVGDLMYGDMRCGIIEINRPGDDIFEDDITEFQDLVGKDNSDEARRVLDVLNRARALIVVEAFWQGEDAEPTLSKLDPLWEWLFAHYDGLSQADNEGFYDRDGLILKRNFIL